MSNGLITLLLVLTFGQQVPKQQPSPPKHAEQGKESPAPPAIPPPVSAPCPCQPAADVQKDSAKAQPSNWTNWVKEPLRLNWPLVAVGIGAIWAALRTLGAIGRQAKIMEGQRGILEDSVKAARDNAKAAEANAQAVGVQTETIKDTAEKQLRAYVCISRSLIKVGKNSIEAEIHVKNFGQTPAYDVRQWIHKWVEKHPLRVALPNPPPEFHMSKAIVGPGDQLIMQGSWQMPADMVVGTIEATVYIYGEVLYRDAFGKERFTRYRLILGGPEKTETPVASLGGVVTMFLKPDTQGNEAN